MRVWRQAVLREVLIFGKYMFDSRGLCISGDGKDKGKANLRPSSSSVIFNTASRNS